MDIGAKANCQNCTQEFYIYKDTHPNKNNMITGMCPNCSTRASVKLEHYNLELYNLNLDPKVTKLPYYPGDGSC